MVCNEPVLEVDGNLEIIECTYINAYKHTYVRACERQSLTTIVISEYTYG
jgi:hypothetical protein